MIINAENLIVGRMASFAAKQALSGEKIDIVNCEKAVFSGSRQEIISKYKIRRDEGTMRHGPFYPRNSDKMIKRIIRGMLPYKQMKGEKAFDKIMCYTGIPEEFKGKQMVSVDDANAEKRSVTKFMTVADLCGELGRQ